MPHMTSIERRGLERGRTERQAEMLLYAVEKRFGKSLPQKLAEQIRQTTDANKLKAWLDLSYICGSLNEFKQRMQR